ncbi:hypothetical protein JHK82_052841 [Glycine max]|nr:hypothetical protein JHK82_052841 [Glycine max]
MRGKNPADTMPFDRKITKTERKNRKKKKQATTRTSENNIAERGGEGNRPPRRRTLDLVMDNKKRRPIISRTKPDLNKTFKEATKAIEVAQVQISLMAGDYKTLEEDEDMAELVDYFIGGDWAPQP